MCTWYVGMGDIEILSYNNHPPKYHNYYVRICNDIHLVGYNSAVKLKLQAYGKVLYHMSRDFDDSIKNACFIICMILRISQ